MKKQQSIGWSIVGVIIAIAVWYFQQKEEKKLAAEVTQEQKGEVSNFDRPKEVVKDASLVTKGAKETSGLESRDKDAARPAVSNELVEAKDLLKVARVTGGGFTVLNGCSLDKSHWGNDGDSFRVKHADQKTEFRLYYVDAPESKYKQYRDGNDNGRRLDQQGAYFGGISRDLTAKVGSAAKKYVIDLLSKRPFTVVTKWENVYGPERKYAFVLVEFEGEKRYLHEVLVAMGLGRIHTKPHPLPDSTSSSRHKDHLRKVEASAKKRRAGAWKLSK